MKEVNLEKLKKDMRERIELRKSDLYRRRKILKVPAKALFEAFLASLVLPEDALYLDAHYDMYEETFAIKYCAESNPILEEFAACPIEQSTIEIETNDDGPPKLRFSKI